MKYVQKDVDESVNRPKDHPLIDFSLLLGGVVVGIGVLVAIALGIARVVSQKISMTDEISLFDRTRPNSKSSAEPTSGPPEVDLPQLQELVNRLWQPFAPAADTKLNVTVVAEDSENAFMGLGGQMTVTSGLLKAASSENELGFVACHEIGHFVHRDVVRGLSAQLLLLAALSFIGLGSEAQGLVNLGVNSSLLSFSRAQEVAADEFALDCLAKQFAHVGGYENFFERVQKSQPLLTNSRFFSYVSTHPVADDRLDHLTKIAAARGYPTNGPTVESSVWRHNDQNEP